MVQELNPVGLHAVLLPIMTSFSCQAYLTPGEQIIGGWFWFEVV